MSVTHDTAHATEIVDRLITQFKKQPNMSGLAAIFGAKIQEVEDALWQLYTQRGISTATGNALDQLGEIVGTIRGGLSDGDYRAQIKARILLNISSGTPDQILQLFTSAFSPTTFSLRDGPTPSIVLSATSAVADATQMGLLLQAAKPAGVYAQFRYGPTPSTGRFKFSDSNHARTTSTAHGFSNSSSPGTGGHLAGSK